MADRIMHAQGLARRQLLKRAAALGLLATTQRLLAGCASRTPISLTPALAGWQTPLSGEVIDLTIRALPFSVDDQTATAVAVNGIVPGPLLRLREGQHIDWPGMPANQCV